MTHYRFEIMLIISLLICNVDLFAQPKVHEKDILLSAGYGFGNLNKSIIKSFRDTNGNYNFKGFGPVFLKFEKGVADKVGVGLNISYLNYYNIINYYDSLGNVQSAWQQLISYAISARVNFHFGNSKIIDPYFGIGTGYRGGNWKRFDSHPEIGFWAGYRKYEKLFPIAFETTFGLRAYPTKKIAAFTEIGIAKSFIQLGISYKISKIVV